VFLFFRCPRRIITETTVGILPLKGLANEGPVTDPPIESKKWLEGTALALTDRLH
jgi:hypothetical protein